MTEILRVENLTITYYSHSGSSQIGVKNIKISLVDKGALDCTIKARIECAVLRACGASDKNIAWGGMIK